MTDIIDKAHCVRHMILVGPEKDSSVVCGKKFDEAEFEAHAAALLPDACIFIPHSDDECSWRNDEGCH